MDDFVNGRTFNSIGSLTWIGGIDWVIVVDGGNLIGGLDWVIIGGLNWIIVVNGGNLIGGLNWVIVVDGGNSIGRITGIFVVVAIAEFFCIGWGYPN